MKLNKPQIGSNSLKTKKSMEFCFQWMTGTEEVVSFKTQRNTSLMLAEVSQDKNHNYEIELIFIS